MKLDRLLAITLELMAKKRVRASDLAARFEVSTRTIYREIELINQAGIPVVSFTGADGGFEIMDGFFLSKQHFTVQDFSVIYQLLQSVEGTVGDRFTLLKDKLGSLHPKLSNREYTDDILLELSTSQDEKETVRVIYHAIQRKKVIGFSYRSASGTVTGRRVEPDRLVWDRGAWYLDGYCLSRRAPRLFRVSRISALLVQEERFQPREPAPAFPEDKPLGMHARLRFERSAEPRVSEQFAGQCRYSGDHIEVETVFYTEAYALSVVLSYGSKVIVLSPPELKEALFREIREIRGRYGEPG
ncbi:helix-turn-helix transcriptional regulator [Paenibacillus sp. DYY-L-2]|uniref:helix-turn-helix transcriptional regulator n=1 Tax=Paenibacillus sp. DYY-L-2 TaxID=3447013 RepID=UPI003F50672E